MDVKKKILKILPFLFPPLLVMAVILYAYYVGKLYPFGEGSVSWCDMNQQVVPLMMNFKDVLDGKSSIFYSFANAGGMNFWGVFFFYLSSPFTFLVKFVDKENMFRFMNILVMLKMMTASVTAMVYFRTCQKRLNTSFAVVLSFMYGMCGYAMMFYQVISWLDVMYLFPLLVLALNILTHKHKILPYIIVMAATVTASFYISYMVVVYLFLFMGLYVLMYSRKHSGRICLDFIIGSALAALASAVVWLPSFMQYSSSARGSSKLIDELKKTDFITHFETILPLFLCTSFIFAAMFISGLKGRRQNRTRKQSFYLYLFVLAFIPMIVEPINKMWQTGNYMSFPGRYGFITIFLGLICCAAILKKEPVLKNKYYMPAGIAISAAVIYIYYSFSQRFIQEKFDTITKYIQTLWGNTDSFRLILELFIVTAACFGIIYALYKKGLMYKQVFAVAICAVAVIEGYSNAKIYMTSTNARNPQVVTTKEDVIKLEDDIDDDSFYRVKTSSKLFDYNLIGAAGYNSLGHYTSLTDQTYMYTMKRLGYTSVWMEVGSCGGTSLTDSILSVGYEITYGFNNDEYNYFIDKLDNKCGLGIVTSKNLSQNQEIPENLERSDIQQYIYSSLFDDRQLIQKYNYSSTDSGVQVNGNYNFTGSGNITYNIYVSGRQLLYFDCFGPNLTARLSEPNYQSFGVTVNGREIETAYPYNTNNGVLFLGEYEDQQVTINVSLLKSTSCSSFGVFGLKQDVLDNALNNTSYVNLQYDGSKLKGSCTANSGESCFLSVPYNEGFTVKINGDKVDYEKCLSGFISFPLQQGDNDIIISFTPKGFVPGLLITILGIGLIAAYQLFRKKLSIPKTAETVACIAVAAAAAGVFIVIYIAPVWLNIMK